MGKTRKYDVSSEEVVRSIVVFGVPVDVEFTFHLGYHSTEFEPEVHEEIYINAVYVDGVDIYHLCGLEALEEIEQQLWRVYDRGGEE